MTANWSVRTLANAEIRVRVAKGSGEMHNNLQPIGYGSVRRRRKWPWALVVVGTVLFLAGAALNIKMYLQDAYPTYIFFFIMGAGVSFWIAATCLLQKPKQTDQEEFLNAPVDSRLKRSPTPKVELGEAEKAKTRSEEAKVIP